MATVNAEPTYQQRIEALAKTKMEHTRLKLGQGGFRDVDDHGFIPWDEPLAFKPKPNHPNGGCYGPKCVGENWRAWLEAHPAYIHPQSALASAWIGTLQEHGVRGWRPEDRPTHLEPLFEKYHLKPGVGGMNHLGPDMQIGLDLGWGGLLKRIRHYRTLNHPVDTSFYDMEEDCVLGVQNYVARHAVKAREMAAAETDPATRANLLQIAEMNEWLVENPPRTLREACQFLAHFQSIDRMYYTGGGLGQLDELLRPYYEADTAAGRLTDDEVVWCIASLFFNDTHYSQIGGQHPDGTDLTSPMSFLILEATHQLKIPLNIAVRVHDGMDARLLRQSVKYLLEDGTGPDYSCSKGLDEGFARNGFPIGLARMRAKVGCNWTALPGIEYPTQDVRKFCLIQPFLLAFYDLVDDSTAEKSIEALWDRYVHHLTNSVEVMKLGLDWHMAHQARNTPEIVLNLFCHGTIERGLDASAGGVDIYDLMFDGVGLANAANSFAAVEQRVVKEKRLTWEELAEHLRSDYRGAENVRLMLKSTPGFGQGDSAADDWARRISQTFSHLVHDTRTPNGYLVNPGLFSHGVIVELGKEIPATPDGRHSGAIIAHSANPQPGFGPTQKANAVAAVQPGYGNSAPLQLDIDRTLAKSLGGVEVVEGLIRAHNAQGGTLININVVSKEQVLEAHKDPEQFPDLVVRVTGYSAYFRMLSPEYRQQVVDRILADA